MNKIKYRLKWSDVDINKEQSSNIIELINKAIGRRGQVVEYDIIGDYKYILIIELDAMSMDHQDSFLVAKIYQNSNFYKKILPFHKLTIELA